MTVILTLKEAPNTFLAQKLYSLEEIIHLFGSNSINPPALMNSTTINSTPLLFQSHNIKKKTKEQMKQKEEEEKDQDQKIVSIFEHISNNPTLKEKFRMSETQTETELKHSILERIEKYVEEFTMYKYESTIFECLQDSENDTVTSIEEKIDNIYMMVLEKPDKVQKLKTSPEESDGHFEPRLAKLIKSYLDRKEHWKHSYQAFCNLQEIEKNWQKKEIFKPSH